MWKNLITQAQTPIRQEKQNVKKKQPDNTGTDANIDQWDPKARPTTALARRGGCCKYHLRSDYEHLVWIMDDACKEHLGRGHDDKDDSHNQKHHVLDKAPLWPYLKSKSDEMQQIIRDWSRVYISPVHQHRVLELLKKIILFVYLSPKDNLIGRLYIFININTFTKRFPQEIPLCYSP